mmetsp:Transcript_41455/g.98231  ORF Transcript_41455/g.98231 Transcript_41455/m.98231 type:complete len:350 (-) Transcript_41455:472-1521(-)
MTCWSSRPGAAPSRLLFLYDNVPEAMVAGRASWCATDYEIISFLSVLSHRSVCTARCKYSGQTVCLKVYNKKKLSNESRGFQMSLRQVYREVRNFGKVTGHENIVLLFCAFENDAAVVLVQEWDPLFASLTTTFQWQRAKPNVVANLASGMLLALRRLHSLNVLHGDLKPDNVLCNSKTGEVKVLDFGLSLDLSRETPSFPTGTLPYCEPEVVYSLLLAPNSEAQRCLQHRFSSKASLKSDIWSLGVIVFELSTGILPFDSMIKQKCIELIVYSDVQSNCELTGLQEQFINRALTKDPERRPSAEQLAADEFLQPKRLSQIWQKFHESISCHSLQDTCVPKLCGPYNQL